MKGITLIVVANGSRARIFQATNNRDLVEQGALIHPQSRQAGRDLETDKPGSSFDRKGTGRHSMEEPTPVKQQEVEKFAREVSSHLDKASQNGDLRRIYIVSSPAFLGSLRPLLGARTRELIAAELDKDLTGSTPAEIREHLPPVL